MLHYSDTALEQQEQQEDIPLTRTVGNPPQQPVRTLQPRHNMDQPIPSNTAHPLSNAAVPGSLVVPPPPPPLPPLTPPLPPPLPPQVTPPLPATPPHSVLPTSLQPPPLQPPPSPLPPTQPLAQGFSPDRPPPNAQASTTKLATFLRSGKAFPILVLTHNRPKLLERMLTSLLTVRGVRRDRIFIAQDGHDPEVLNVVRKFGLKVDIHENPRVNGPPWKVGAVKIARHYKWSFSRMFDMFDTETPAAIVVEDDLLFAPDFLEYFHAVAPLLDQDPTLWAASSWNDNGFDYLVKEPKEVKRTGFFPGLGWCMTRKLWHEIGGKWPQEHWDHWLRQPAQHLGREVLTPAMPRVYHNGVKGTFMDRKTHNKYFARIATNRDETVAWDIPWDYGGASVGMDTHVVQAEQNRYEQRLTNALKSPRAVHVQGINELRDPLVGVEGTRVHGEPVVVVVWISVDIHPRPGMPQDFKPMANFFGVWHEARRGAWRGVHEMWIHDATVQLLLVNVHPSVGKRGFRGLKPPGVRLFDSGVFRGVAPLKKGKKGVVGVGKLKVGYG